MIWKDFFSAVVAAVTTRLLVANGHFGAFWVFPTHSDRIDPFRWQFNAPSLITQTTLFFNNDSRY